MSALRARFALDSSDSGGASAEFAVLLPILLLLIFVIFDLGRMFWIQNDLQFAAEEAGRWVMVNASPTPSAAVVQAQFNNRLSAVAPGEVTFATAMRAIPGSVAGRQAFQINASYTFSFMSSLSAFPGFSLPSVILNGQLSVPIN